MNNRYVIVINTKAFYRALFARQSGVDKGERAWPNVPLTAEQVHFLPALAGVKRNVSGLVEYRD